MFNQNDENYLVACLQTTKYLGTKEIIRQIVALFSKFGGIYIPEKWGEEERGQQPFDMRQADKLQEYWVTPVKSKYLFFSRSKPVKVQMYFLLERHSRAKFNYFSLFIKDRYFSSSDKFDELFRFILNLSEIMHVDYGFIAHAQQEKKQSPPLTPAERLPGVFWVNILGKPYIDLFGREKIMGTPSHKVTEINDRLIVIQTASSPVDASIIKNDRVSKQIMEYLGVDMFAGPFFPHVPCRVPNFDFGDLRPQASASSANLDDIEIKDEIAGMGGKQISSSQSELQFYGEDGSVVKIDTCSKEIAVDLTDITT